MKKADLILIAVIAVVAGAMLFVLYGLNSNAGTYVQVEIDGVVCETLPLSKDTTYEINSADGGENTLVIEDGWAKITSANCPDETCTNQKKISRAGESIICLPHKVVVSVISDKATDDEIDAVA